MVTGGGWERVVYYIRAHVLVGAALNRLPLSDSLNELAGTAAGTAAGAAAGQATQGKASNDQDGDYRRGHDIEFIGSLFPCPGTRPGSSSPCPSR